jgi:hypothetical protein
VPAPVITKVTLSEGWSNIWINQDQWPGFGCVFSTWAGKRTPRLPLRYRIRAPGYYYGIATTPTTEERDWMDAGNRIYSADPHWAIYTGRSIPAKVVGIAYFNIDDNTFSDWTDALI